MWINWSAVTAGVEPASAITACIMTARAVAACVVTTCAGGARIVTTCAAYRRCGAFITRSSRRTCVAMTVHLCGSVMSVACAPFTGMTSRADLEKSRPN